MADEQQITPPPSNEPARDATGTIVDQTPKPDASPPSDSSLTLKAPEGTESPDPKKPETKPSLSDDKDPKAPEGAPEKYEPFKAPEGIEFDAAKLEEATGLFKELGLSQESAQKLVDKFGPEFAAAAEAPYKAYQDMRNDWRTEVIKDPALGNGTDGLKPEVRTAISRTIDNGLGPELGKAFREAMNFTGVGDHPAFVRGILALSKFVAEGSPVKAGGPVPPAGTKKPSAAQALYPSLPSAG